MIQNPEPSARAQLHAHVEPAVRERLAALARDNDRSIAAEIRRAIAEHIERERQAGSRER